MASANRSISARRSRRIAGLEPQRSSHGARLSGENVVGLRRRSARHGATSPVNINCGSVPRRRLARSHRRTSVPMVEPMTSPTTSDSSSQTSDVPVISPDTSTAGPSAVPGVSAALDQPSTSHGSGAGGMGTAFGSNRTSAAAGSENETRDASRRRHHRGRRHAQHRAIMAAYRGIPSSMPVKGESYCDCPKQGRDLTCTCGEEDTGLFKYVVVNFTSWNFTSNK